MVAVLSNHGSGGLAPQRPELTLGSKFRVINWGLVLLVCIITSVGVALLYSAAGGNWKPWAQPQLVRAVPGLILMLMIALVDVRHLMKSAYAIFLIVLCLLVAVELMGRIGMGAQRWIDLGFIQLQPSEIMKIALILTLARYFHGATMQDVVRPMFLVPPLIMVLAPIALVLKQPDLGTAMMLLMSSGAIFFMAGVRLWKFGVLLAGGLGAIPIAWQFLHEYQRKRVLVFLNPDQDPLGSGYHITQSKIALGSGGMFGKGYMNSTQAKLNFLPEKQTDFIFTMYGEEWGMVGGLFLLGLYVLLVAFGYAISLRCRSQFGRLVGLGITTTFFLYFFINTAMVMGLVPVVGVPLPLISYGGTAMLSLLFGWGLVMSAYIHRDLPIGRRGSHED